MTQDTHSKPFILSIDEYAPFQRDLFCDKPNDPFDIYTSVEIQPGVEVIKLFSSSAQLSMKFQLLMNVKIVKISVKFRFKTQKVVIYPAHKC